MASSSKKYGSAYAQSPRKCSNIEIPAKSKEKKRNFFRKFTKGIEGFDLGQKNSKLSHACVPLIKLAENRAKTISGVANIGEGSAVPCLMTSIW